MATHPSYTIDNADGATFRADLNTYIDALVTNNSSPTEPMSPQAGMFWIDTGVTPVILRLRDSTNTLWTPIYNVTNGRGILSTTAVNANSLNGIYASSGLVENTILKNDTATGIKGDVIGNITGYVDTVGGDDLATILDITTRSHKNLPVTNGNFTITSGAVLFRHATSGFEEIVSYKSAVSAASVDALFSGLMYGSTPDIREFYVAVNTVNVSGIFDTVFGALFQPEEGFRRKVTLTNISLGDTISMYCDNGSGGNPTFGRYTLMSLGLRTNEYGHNTSLSGTAI